MSIESAAVRSPEPPGDPVPEAVDRVSGTATRRDLTALDQERRLEHDELVNDVLRQRWLAAYALLLWPAFGVLDAIVVTFIEPGNAWFYAAVRVLGMIPIGGGVLLLWRAAIHTRLTLTLIELFVTCSTTIGVSLLALEYRGLSSPYFAGILTVIVIRGSVLADPWPRGVVLVGVPALMFPSVLLVACAFSPQLAAQLSHPEQVWSFVQSLFFIFTAVAICVYGGHTTWALRRQVFEARNIGRYRLKHRIGKGGMGEVWVAFDSGLKRDVALKILRPGMAQDPTLVLRFEQEVAATARLTHPNTVRVFDYGVTDDGIWYYAMELLEGSDLRTLVRHEGKLPVVRACRIAHQVARALAEAHAQSIVHRDIKPENIYVTRAGYEPDFVKVLDFGIARLMDTPAGAELTVTGSIFGTPAYISPEAAAGRPADPRSDVYSVGAVLHFMIAGEPPFGFDTPGELLLKQVLASPPSLSALDPSVPAPVSALVLRCLAKEPDERLRDGGELAAALGDCLVRAGLVPEGDPSWYMQATTVRLEPSSRTTSLSQRDESA